MTASPLADDDFFKFIENNVLNKLDELDRIGHEDVKAEVAEDPYAVNNAIPTDAPQAIYCKACEMWLNGPTQYGDHKIGKKHRKNLRKAAQEAQAAQDQVCETDDWDWWQNNNWQMDNIWQWQEKDVYTYMGAHARWHGRA